MQEPLEVVLLVPLARIVACTMGMGHTACLASLAALHAAVDGDGAEAAPQHMPTAVMFLNIDVGNNAWQTKGMASLRSSVGFVACF